MEKCLSILKKPKKFSEKEQALFWNKDKSFGEKKKTFKKESANKLVK